MATVEFFYDIGSPYSYLASTRIEAVAADCKAEVRFRPMLLGGLFKSVGNTPPAFMLQKAKYMSRDLQRWADYYGVPFNLRMPPANTLLPMRVLAGMPDEALPAATHTLFHAYWVDGKDATEASVVRDLLGDEAVARAELQEVKDRLRANTEEAVQRGAFGAPTMWVGDEMFFGNDRLPFLEQHLRSVKA